MYTYSGESVASPSDCSASPLVNTYREKQQDYRIGAELSRTFQMAGDGSCEFITMPAALVAVEIANYIRKDTEVGRVMPDCMSISLDSDSNHWLQSSWETV